MPKGNSQSDVSKVSSQVAGNELNGRIGNPKGIYLTYEDLQASSSTANKDALSLMKASQRWSCDDAQQVCEFLDVYEPGFNPTGAGFPVTYFSIEFDYSQVHPLGIISLALKNKNTSAQDSACYVKFNPINAKAERICKDYNDVSKQRDLTFTVLDHGTFLKFKTDIINQGSKYEIAIEAVTADGSKKIESKVTKTLNGKRVEIRDLSWEEVGQASASDFKSFGQAEDNSGEEDNPDNVSCEDMVIRHLTDRSGPRMAQSVTFDGNGNEVPTVEPLYQKLYLSREVLGLLNSGTNQESIVFISLSDNSGNLLNDSNGNPISEQSVRVYNDRCVKTSIVLPKDGKIGDRFNLKIRQGDAKPSCTEKAAMFSFQSVEDALVVEQGNSFSQQQKEKCEILPMVFKLAYDTSGIGTKIPSDYKLEITVTSDKFVKPLLKYDGTASELNDGTTLPSIDLELSASIDNSVEPPPNYVPSVDLFTGGVRIKVKITDNLGVDCKTHTNYEGEKFFNSLVDGVNSPNHLSIGLSPREEVRACGL